MAKGKKPVKASTKAMNDGFASLDLPRMATADLLKPPSAVKRRHVSRASIDALAKHDGKAGKTVRHTNRKDPKAKRVVETSYSRMPTPERQARDEFMRMPGERIDTKHKGEMLLVNLSNRARGAGVMFNRGLISLRELRAAMAICELAELAQASQLSGLPLAERVEGGRVDLDGSRLRAAAAAHRRYRELVEELSKCGRILVENCVVIGMPMEEAVRLRTLAMRLGSANSLKNRVGKAMTLMRDALDHLADLLRLPEA